MPEGEVEGQMMFHKPSRFCAVGGLMFHRHKWETIAEELLNQWPRPWPTAVQVCLKCNKIEGRFQPGWVVIPARNAGPVTT